MKVVVTLRMREALRALGSGDADDARTGLSILILDTPADALDRALPLHVLALVEFEHGNPGGSRVLLSEAAGVERAAGLEGLALHTSHQIALLTQSGATVPHVGHYYKETYETLVRMGRRDGAGLCLKSMAEMYLAAGKVPGALDLLRRAGKLLRACGDPAAAHVEAWVDALGA